MSIQGPSPEIQTQGPLPSSTPNAPTTGKPLNGHLTTTVPKGESGKEAIAARNSLSQFSEAPSAPLTGKATPASINFGIKSSIEKIRMAVSLFFSSVGNALLGDPLSNLERKINTLEKKIDSIETNAAALKIAYVDVKQKVKKLTLPDLSLAGETAQSINTSTQNLSKLNQQYIALTKKDPDLSSLRLLNKLNALTIKLDAGIVNVNLFVNLMDKEDQNQYAVLNPVTKLETTATVLKAIPKTSFETALKVLNQNSPTDQNAHYNVCIKDRAAMANPLPMEGKSIASIDENTIEGGLNKDYARKCAAHVFYSTAESLVPTESVISQIKSSDLDPLLISEASCHSLINYYTDPTNSTTSIPVTAQHYLSLNDPNSPITVELPIDTAEKTAQAKEQLDNNKETILKFVSSKLSETLKQMDSIVGNSISFKEKIEESRNTLNKINKELNLPAESSSLTETDRIQKVKIETDLKKEGFSLSAGFNSSSEIAAETLSRFPNLSDPQKSALLQSLRLVTTSVLIKTFSTYLDPAKLSEKEPCSINIFSDSQGNPIVTQKFTLNSLSRDVLDEQVDSSKPWDEIEGRRAFNCEVVLDIAKGTCTHKVTEMSNSIVDPISHIETQMSNHRLSKV